jgi:Ca2+-binding EF-hand superfamily protein
LKKLADAQAEQERKARQAVQLEKVWGEVDQDGSGTLDAEELKTVLLNMGRTDDIDEVMEQVDEDGSGEVDYDEFCQWFQTIDQPESARPMIPSGPSKRMLRGDRDAPTAELDDAAAWMHSPGKDDEEPRARRVDIDVRQFGLAEVAAGQARIRAIAIERRALMQEQERLNAEKAEAEAAHEKAEVKRELDEVIYHLTVELDAASSQMKALQEEEETIERKERGEFTAEEEASILRLEDLQVAEPSAAAQFLLGGGAHTETTQRLRLEGVENEEVEEFDEEPATKKKDAGGAVEKETLLVPADGAGAELTLGCGGDGASEHTVQVSAAVDGARAEVEIDFEIDAFDGQRHLFGMPDRLQLAGSVVTVTARSNRPGAAVGLFDDGRVKLTLAHCHAGPAARLRVLHEAAAVAGDNVEETLLEHEWSDLKWSVLERGKALTKGCEIGFVSIVAPRPGRYVVARAMVDPKAQRRGAQADLDRVFILPTPRHSGGKMNIFEPLSFALTAFPAQKALVNDLVATADLGDLSSNWPIAEGVEEETAAAVPVFGVSDPRVGGPFVVARGQPVTVEMLLPPRPESRGPEDGKDESQDPPRSAGGSSQRTKSPVREPRRRSPLRSALSSRLSSARSSINSARSSLSSRASRLRRSPQRAEPEVEPEPEPEPEPVLDPAELPEAVSLCPMAVTSVDWWGQPTAVLRLGLRLEADEATIRDAVRLPFQLSLTFQIPKLDMEHLSLSALLDKKSELDLKTQEQAMILQAAQEEELVAEPAHCLLRFEADGRPWPKMFAGDCLGVHLGELRADQTGHAQAEAAAESMTEHRAATKLQKVWRGKVGRAKQLKALFLQYDYDNSGTLEREEVASLLRKLGAVRELADIDLTMARMCGMASLAEDVAMGMAIPSVTTDEFENWFKQRTVAKKNEEENEAAVFGEIHAQQQRAAKVLADAKAKEGKVAWHEPLKMLMLVFRMAKDWRRKRREKDYVVELPGAAAALAAEKVQP